MREHILINAAELYVGCDVNLSLAKLVIYTQGESIYGLEH